MACALMLGAALSHAADWPSCGAVDQFPGADWNKADPERHGWDVTRLSEAEALYRSLDSSAVMVVYQGYLVAAWGDTQRKYTAQSVRKSLINSLIGIAVDEGDLRLNATLEELEINDTKPTLTDSERRATVEDLLLSRSGVFHSALYEVGGWKRVREAIHKDKLRRNDGTYLPGKYWVYNNWDFNTLGTILEDATDASIGSLFHERIAIPTNMQDFEPADVDYTTKESRAEEYLGNWSEHRAYVFDISTRDLARYGLLYLNCGTWNAKSVLPRSWVMQSIEGIDTREGRLPEYRDTGFGDYGYLWQVDREGSRRYEHLDTAEPFYMATGNRGHLLVVMPYLDLVIAHQVATVGGIGFEAQKKRAQEGSPTVDRESLQRLLAAIIAAHPNEEGARVGR